jgi:hypothetical protein
MTKEASRLGRRRRAKHWLVATGLRGNHFHRNHRYPGNQLLPPAGGRLGRSRGASGAERSELALGGTQRPLASCAQHRPREGAFSVEDVVCVCALHRRQVTRGEELSVVHRVGPWLPVIPVDLVPGVVVTNDAGPRRRARQAAQKGCSEGMGAGGGARCSVPILRSRPRKPRAVSAASPLPRCSQPHGTQRYRPAST